MWGHESGTVTINSGNSDSGRTILMAVRFPIPFPSCGLIELGQSNYSVEREKGTFFLGLPFTVIGHVFLFAPLAPVRSPAIAIVAGAACLMRAA